MSAINLTPEQKRAIRRHLQAFDSEQLQEEKKYRLSRVSYFQERLPERVAELSEADVSELVAMLWASQMWGNKQYLALKIITDNGIEKLRRELKALLDTSSPVETRYERFLSQIKGLGPASVTEMLCYIQPETCGIWNQKARQALKILGLGNYVNPDKYRLSAGEYKAFNQVLRSISEELKAAGFQDVDLLFVDFFLYEVSQTTPGPEPKPEEFDHDEIRDVIRDIGVMLGFDADTEVQVAHGARVDVVWRARIGNLGMVTYVFEVHRSGSIDSLLLNLQKAKSSPTVQKVIAVSDERQLEKIKSESEGLPEGFRRALEFWPVKEVQRVGENLQTAMEIINRLGLGTF